MFSSSVAMEREFHPQYSFSWYVTHLFILVIAGTYLTSKILGEHLDGLVQMIGLGAIASGVFSIALTVKRIEFGTKFRLHYILWPAKSLDYKDILEIRLPEIIVNSDKPIKLENIVNLDELQQEFKSLEMIGMIQRGHIRELKSPSSKYSFKPKIGNILLALFTAFTLGSELFKISKEVNVLWMGILAIYFMSDIFNKLFRKSTDE